MQTESETYFMQPIIFILIVLFGLRNC